MSAEHNLDLVGRMDDSLNAQLDAHDAIWTEDMIWHGPPGLDDVIGRTAFKYEVLLFYAAFPDCDAKNDIEFDDDTWVGATGFVTGTHSGPWMGLAATGKPMRMRFSDFWRVRENRMMVDHVDVFKQLGVDLMKMVG